MNDGEYPHFDPLHLQRSRLYPHSSLMPYYWPHQNGVYPQFPTAHCTKPDLQDVPDQTGKTVLITGANLGLGFALTGAPRTLVAF